MQKNLTELKPKLVKASEDTEIKKKEVTENKV